MGDDLMADCPLVEGRALRDPIKCSLGLSGVEDQPRQTPNLVIGQIVPHLIDEVNRRL